VSKSATVSLVAIGAIAALVYFYYGRNKPVDPAPPPVPTAAAAPQARSAPAASAPAPTWTVTTSPLPATGTAPVVAPSMKLAGAPAAAPQTVQRTPVKELQAALQQVGTQGDAQISCRLGVELIRCMRLDYRQAMLKASQNALDQAPKDDPKTIQGLAELEDRRRLLAEDRTVCGGSMPVGGADAWKHLYQAAAAGNVAAMSQFVRDPGMDPRDPAMEEGWEAFKRKAPEFLTKAIQGGDVKALWQGWFTANSGYSAGTNKTFERDPYKALVYGLVVVNMVDAQRSAQVAMVNPALIAQLGPERAAQAQKEAETLRAASFADQNNAAPIEWSTDSGETDSGECLK
jgi:hypothetical protein